jgi:hypothetical protein
LIKINFLDSVPAGHKRIYLEDAVLTFLHANPALDLNSIIPKYKYQGKNHFIKLYISHIIYYIYTVIPFTTISVMKRPTLFILLLTFVFTAANSQQVIRQQSCSNPMINQQVDSLKNMYSTKGFSLLREASISMESEYEMPVVMQLTQGSWYEFVFIGEYTSKLYEVRMYDWDEKMVVYQKKQWGDIDGNVINYSYIPRQTEFHMMKPVQVNKQKKKDLCGYVMLFRKEKTNANP